MSPYEIRADLLFSLSGSLSNWNGFMLCLVKERERALGSFRQPTLHLDSSSSSSQNLNLPLLHTTTHSMCFYLGELLGVCMCMRDDFSSLVAGMCFFFFFFGRSRIDDKNRPAHKKSLREKHVLLPPPPSAHTLHPPIIIPAGGRRLQLLSIQTGNASKWRS